MFVLPVRCEYNFCPTYANRIPALANRIRASRPTAVNLSWALDRMTVLFKQWIAGKDKISSTDFQEIKTLLRVEAVRIKEEDIEMCKQIARHGVALIASGSRILTHCNAGHLAVSRYGTAWLRFIWLRLAD